MPWSRVLNWNRLPAELSSSPSLFLRPVHPSFSLHIHRLSTLPLLPCLLSLSLPFFLLRLSIYYRPSSASPPPPPPFFVRSFLVRGAERSLIADGRRTSRPRDRIGNEGQKFADPSLYIRMAGESAGRQESEESRGGRGGEGEREREIRWHVTRCSYPRRVGGICRGSSTKLSLIPG